VATRARSRSSSSGSSALIRRIPSPGIKGMVTDRQSWELDPQETPFAQDAIAPEGVMALRANPAAFAAAPGVNTLISCCAADLPQISGVPTLQQIVTDTVGNVYNWFNSAWRTNAGSVGTPALIREIYKGEAIICPLDGVSSIRRLAGGPMTALAAATGTVSTTAGSTVVTGAGTNFATQAPVGSYIAIAGIQGFSFKVVNTLSATQLAVDTPIPITLAGVGWLSSYLGQIGLATPVSNPGTITITNGSAAVTGQGTSFSTPVLLNAALQAGDGIAPTGSFDRLAAIQSITSQTALTLTAVQGATYTNVPYVGFRSLVGREARIYSGILFVTGVDWLPNHIFYLPPGADLGVQTNGIQSFATDYGDAHLAQFFTVPSPQASGRIVALLTTPEGMLVLRTDDTWMVYGTPTATSAPTFGLFAKGAGCVDMRSAISCEYGQIWCGMEGIYLYTGGRIVDIAEQGGRGREWRALMKNWFVNFATNLNTTVACGVIDGHLIVSVQRSQSPVINQVWVYDLIAQCWRSNFSNMAPSYFYMWRAQTLNMASGATTDTLYFTQNQNAPGDSPKLFQDNAMLRDEGAVATDLVYNGTFICDIPESATGPDSDLERVVEEKVVYELTGGNSTTKLVCQSGVDGGALGTDASLATTANGPQEARVLPQSDVTQAAGGAIGALGRRHTHRVTMSATQPAGQPSALRLHEVDLVVRPRRPRA
jgi:hypothetical protein